MIESKGEHMKSDPWIHARETLLSDIMLEKCVSLSQAEEIYKEIIRTNPHRFLNYLKQFEHIQRENIDD